MNVHMIERMVLVRAVDGTWEGWRCMALEEFLRRVDLEAWMEHQLLIGMVLPPASRAARGKLQGVASS